VWKEGSVKEYGEADAYGHRKKVDIGQALGEEIRKRTGDEIMVSDLTYDLRSGEPDAIDQLVGITYANIAVDMLRDGVTGRMVGCKMAAMPMLHSPRPLWARAKWISPLSTTRSATARTTAPS